MVLERVVPLLCPAGAEDVLVPEDRLRAFLAHPTLLRVTPATGSAYGPAVTRLRDGLRRWRAWAPDADGYPWATAERWNWERDPDPRGTDRRAIFVERHHPYRAGPARRRRNEALLPVVLYRADGIQEPDVMRAEHATLPLHTNRVLPTFWTPFPRVARIYGSRCETIYAATVQPDQPYWSFAERCNYDAAAGLVDVFRAFLDDLLPPTARERPPRGTTTTPVDRVFEYLQRKPHRVSWPGDLIALLLFILRAATDANTVPNLIVFRGDWELPDAHQQTCTSPEIVILHPDAIEGLSTVPD